MAKKNWMAALSKLEGAVIGDYDPWKHVLRTPSPSVNFLFGNGHGLPEGYTMLLGGPPKGGKTLLCNAIVGQLHKDQPEAWALKFDTEMREQGQLTDQQASLWGIDRDRYLAYSVNAPDLVFDRIEGDIAAQCQEGLPLKLVIIDSITGIQGRRAMNADTINTQQIGDLALTLQDGLKRILAVQRKYKFAMILTTHIRAEMDQLEQKRGNKVKMAAAFGVQHFAEWFVFVEPNRNKEGRTDLAGNEFKSDDLSDIAGNADQTGHKIRVKVKDASMGPKGRVAELTLDYHNGVINTHEEVFLLADNRGVLVRPNNMSYEFGGKKWVGKQSMLDALKTDKALYDAVLAEVYRRDEQGAYAAQDAVEAA